MTQPLKQTGPDPPLVSVVVPTCNRREVLQRCVEALARQTHPDYEVIVVDDCSTDDTPEFLRRFAADHPDLNIRCLRNEAHAGANPSRNRGIREAKGEFVAFEDSDCIAEADWLDRLVDGFTSDRVAAVVGLVKDLPPTNIYELTFKGTHRVAGAGAANNSTDIVEEHAQARRSINAFPASYRAGLGMAPTVSGHPLDQR